MSLKLFALIFVSFSLCQAEETIGVKVTIKDGSVLSGFLKNEKMEMETPYGKLSIPLKEVQRIDIGQLITEEEGGPYEDTLRVGTSIFVGKLLIKKFKYKNEALGIDGLERERVSSIAIESPPQQGEMPNLTSYVHQVGQIVSFVVTGSNQGICYGTDIYTTDSNLGMCAVHAGLLKVGQQKELKMRILPPRVGFNSTTRHGITTTAWATAWGAFQFLALHH